MGLLGTVVGLVKSFYIIEQKAASAGMVNPSDIAGGIWVALLTTVCGLCVAIISYLAYNYFVHKVNTYVLGVEQASTEMLEILLDIQIDAA
jgi:biopolymer transport protein ExbB